jgi:hypothetical protein
MITAARRHGRPNQRPHQWARMGGHGVLVEQAASLRGRYGVRDRLLETRERGRHRPGSGCGPGEARGVPGEPDGSGGDWQPTGHGGQRDCRADRTLADEHLSQQAADPVADRDGRPAECADDAGQLFGQVADADGLEDLLTIRGRGLTRPPVGDAVVAVAVELLGPRVPRAGVHPQAVDEHHQPPSIVPFSGYAHRRPATSE